MTARSLSRANRAQAPSASRPSSSALASATEDISADTLSFEPDAIRTPSFTPQIG
jgi:hypothetical protein